MPASSPRPSSALSAPRRLSAGALVGQALLALAAFAAGTLLIRTRVPVADEVNLATKLVYFEAHEDEYDALYLGSSRFQRGLDTVQIDAELGRAGFPLRSFNFGVNGLNTFELDYVLHRLLAREPRRLRIVFLEAGPVSTTLSAHHPFRTERILYGARGMQWHTPRETRNVLACLARARLPLAEKLDIARVHLDVLARNLGNLGRGPEIATPWLPGGGAPSRVERLARNLARSGTEGLDPKDYGELVPELERFRTDAEGWRAEVAQVVRENALAVPPDEVDAGFYRRQAAVAARHGVELIYVTAPSMEGSPEILRLSERGHVTRLFHFNDPERYPELFQLENRCDRGHVNTRGRQLFSTLFAGVLRAHLETRTVALPETGG